MRMAKVDGRAKCAARRILPELKREVAKVSRVDGARGSKALTSTWKQKMVVSWSHSCKVGKREEAYMRQLNPVACWKN